MPIETNEILEFIHHQQQQQQLFQICGRDNYGHKILRIIGKFFPGKIGSVESVKKYLEEYVYPELEDEPFSIFYFNARVQKEENYSGISALKSIADAIPIKVRDNLQTVYFVHPGCHSRLFLATFGRYIFSGGLYGKFKYMSRLDYVWGKEVSRMEIEIPQFVYDRDRALDYRPMMLGMDTISEHPRFRCAVDLEYSPFQTYSSSNCIS